MLSLKRLPAAWLLPVMLPAMVVAESADEEALVFEQLGAREQILDMQREAAEATTRKRALLAYRMARHRELGFSANPDDRLDHASGFDLAVVGLRRSVEETQALARELDRVRSDRTTMESALIARTLEASRKVDAHTDSLHVRFLRPVRGTPVATPGVRRDGPTKVALRYDSLDLLTRLNDPVRAVASGVIKCVDRRPQGGFAVVIAHAEGVTSILTGLRDVSVVPNQSVEAGQTVGMAGRNLDGAAVISLEIWRNRRPLDAAELLRRTPKQL